MNGFPTTQTQR